MVTPRKVHILTSRSPGGTVLDCPSEPNPTSVPRRERRGRLDTKRGGHGETEAEARGTVMSPGHLESRKLVGGP